MNDYRLNIMYFSPTGSSKKIARAIADGMDFKYKEYDLTYNRDFNKLNFGEKDILIVTIPVYAGRVPELLLEPFSKIKGEGSLFLPVVVYGNRAVEDAAVELSDIFNSNGFKTIGYGIFIGEHSYSSEFAENRPDSEDLKDAKIYGKTIRNRIESVVDKNSIFKGEVPGNRPYRDRAPKLELWGPVANDSCTFCGECIANCPVDAIAHLNPKSTDYTKCIHCCACVKVCKESAKHMEGQTVDIILDLLDKVARGRKEIELG